MAKHWACGDIILAYEMGLINAWPADPDIAASRRQAAVLLADGLGLVPLSGDLPLADVSAEDPDRPWFVALFNEGIFRGDDGGCLRPDAPLSRAEFAAITARAAGPILAVERESAPFADLAGHWAQSEVALACSLNLVNGVGDNRFEPDRCVSLAELLTMIVRMVNGRPAPGAALPTEKELADLAVLDLSLWARAYSQTPMPDWNPVYENLTGVALYIMKESAAVEDAYRLQGHSGVAVVNSAKTEVVTYGPLSAAVRLDSSGTSIWDGVPASIVDSSVDYIRRVKGRWMIYKSLSSSETDQ